MCDVYEQKGSIKYLFLNEKLDLLNRRFLSCYFVDGTEGCGHTGWGDELWTAFTGPPLPPLGGCERKDQ
jgi:hypothetical protein